jgi:hypothetical protein
MTIVPPENFAPASGEVLSLLAGSRAGDEIAAVVCAETSKSPTAAKRRTG